MAKRLYDNVKMDIGLVPQALNNTNKTGRFYGVAMWREITALLIIGAMAAGTTAKVEVLQARDADGTDSKVIEGADATISANTKVTAAQVVVGTPVNGDTVTINGTVFTKAAATDAAAREFADAAGLETCINNGDTGVTGVEASNTAGTITLQASWPGDTTITVSTSNAAQFTVSTLQALAFVSLTASQLDLANDFSHIGVKVTTTANTVASAELLCGVGRFMPDQQVAASAKLT